MGRGQRDVPSEARDEAPAPDARRESALDRRSLLQHGLTAAAGLVGLGMGGGLASAAPAQRRRARVKAYVPLGTTDIKMSDISMGTGALGQPQLLRQALARGVNYIDTADGYPIGAPGHAERVIGNVLGARRKEVVLATKTNGAADATAADMMAKLEASLGRLRTDYVDVYFNQAVNDPARALNPEWPEFVARAKKQGKIRYAGMSGHGGRLLECLGLVLDRDFLDVILVAYNFGQDPAFYEKLTRNFDIVANQKGLPRVLAKAKSKGIGVIAMKTLFGAKLNDMRPWEEGGHTYAQAAFRWVLSNPDVDAMIVSMKSVEQIDEYLGASGSKAVSQQDVRILQRYLAMNGHGQCRYGCSGCESACPAGVQISDVLRSRMYAVDYGEHEMGRATYAEVATNAEACGTCTHESCLRACPYGVSIPELARSAEALLGRG